MQLYLARTSLIITSCLSLAFGGLVNRVNAEPPKCGRISYQQVCENWHCDNMSEKGQTLASVIAQDLSITNVGCFDSEFCSWCKAKTALESAKAILSDKKVMVRQYGCLAGAHHMLVLDATLTIGDKDAHLYVSNTGLACLKINGTARYDWTTAHSSGN